MQINSRNSDKPWFSTVGGLPCKPRGLGGNPPTVRADTAAWPQTRNAFRNWAMLLGTAVSGFSFPSISSATQPR